MSESSNSAWPFGEISGEEGLDIEAIFKDSTGADQSNPFASPVEAAASDPAPEAQEPPAEPAEPVPAPNLAAASAPTPKEPETPAAPAPKPTAAPPAEKPALAQPEVSAAAENPIAAAFEQKTAENTKKGLLEKPPVFYHKGVKEEIEEPSMTFEELRIRKSEDFTDLEEGKRVSWSVEYCGIHGKKECGPNGSKQVFLNVGKVFLRALARDLGLHDVTVSSNAGGIGVSGECSLIGMWENGGLYVSISQPACGSGKVLLYRTVRHSKDYKGGYNHFITRSELEKCSYLQVALCLNARMEDMLNVTDTKMNGTLPFSSQLADAVREAVRDYHEGSMYKRDEAVRTFRRNLFPRWKPSLGNVLACCDIFQIILEAAYEKYVSAANQNNQNYQEIARLGYVSKAYLVLAAIGTSGGALNLLAQMLINQANQYEADQRIPFFRRHPDIGTFVQQHAAPYGWPLNDNYALAYRVLQIVCGIQRGSQPYSHMKKAELVLKGYVSESSSTQLTSLNIAINGGLAMGHYWKGRLLLEQAKQDHDRCNDYKDAAIASFCATNVTERFDHLPENADEDAAPQLSPPQWLSAIELLRYPDREVFRVDRRMVFQTIYQKLTQQVEEVQSDRIQIHNERYRLTKKDVRSNMERCLDMVKVQFPDKEPLIQEMIRSIR